MASALRLVIKYARKCIDSWATVEVTGTNAEKWSEFVRRRSCLWTRCIICRAYRVKLIRCRVIYNLHFRLPPIKAHDDDATTALSLRGTRDATTGFSLVCTTKTSSSLKKAILSPHTDRLLNNKDGVAGNGIRCIYKMWQHERLKILRLSNDTYDTTP